MKQWYALYTKPRWEKKVNSLLQSRGLVTYCPLNKIRKKWSDRFKVVEEPLFKSYVFVSLDASDLTLARQIDGVVNFVYWLGKPAIVKDSDIEKIKRFLNEYHAVEVISTHEPRPGDRVIITAGVLMEQEGTVLSSDKKRVEVRIESLGCKLVAQVDREKITVK